MRLVELRVHALPGVDEPFVVRGFAPGTNLVVGPNASGKSRLVHAVRTLVDPEASRGAGAHVEARFDDRDGQVWRATRVGDAVRWERDGEPADPPPLPAGHLLDGLFLNLEDLHRFGRADLRIADRLASELAGGVDLPRARSELAGLGPRYGSPLRSELERAREALGKVRRQRDALAADEQELVHWEERRGRAQAQAASAPLLRSALDVLATRRALASVEARARTYPAGLDGLHEGVVQDADALADAVDRAVSEVGRQEAELDAADAQKAATGLEDGRPDAAQVASWQAAAEALADAERTVRDAERHAAERAGRVAALQEASGPDPLGAVVGPTPLELDELDAIADEAQRARSEARVARLALREIPPSPEPSVDPDRAHRAVDLLSDWLATPDARGRWRRRARSVAYLAAVVGAAGAAWLSLDALDLSSRAARLLILAGASAAVGVVLDAGAAAERHRARRARREARTSFADAVAEPPTVWTRAAVRARLAQAASDAAEARHAREAEAIRSARRVQLHAELEEAEIRSDRLERQLADRAARAGLHAGEAGRSALERARRAAELREAGQSLRGARQAEAAAIAHLQQARSRLDTELRAAGLAEILRAHGDEPTPATVPASATVRARLAQLAERVRRRDQAAARREAADRARARAHEELDRVRARRDELLAAMSDRPLDQVQHDPADAMRELRRRADRLPDWRRLRDERIRLEGVLDHHLAIVDADAGVRAQVEAGDETALRHALDEALAAADRADEATGAIAAIDERLARARRERDLTAARQVERQAHDALEHAYEQVLDGEAAAAVLDHLEHAFRSERRPAALQRAETWFARFTHHAFALAFDTTADGAERVHAVDRTDGRTDGRKRALDELSSGTKAQLLLALRLAHALEAEQGGPSLPLVLDEALTTSDVGRFAAVAEALTTLTRDEGRQVLYLSARRDDAVLWRELADRSEGRIEAPTVLDLAEIRGRQETTPTLGARPPAWREPPAPNGLDAVGYASVLGVPPVDPWRPERIHPLHLLHDRLDLVHALVRLRIVTIGALSSLLADGPQAERLLGTADLELLGARVTATRAWSRRWRIGRGRAVDRAALAASDAVSAAFLDRVAEIADASSGDAEALLAALARGEVKRFRDDAREALAAWLREHGYLDPRPASTPAERVLAVEHALHEASREGRRDDRAAHSGASATTLAAWLESGWLASDWLA
ncbi:MAG: hypothetical protein U5J97_00655 [Trueperaceae bacterium]|nr:hypothetical protein [Trueperaceae bacterium]